MPAAERILVRTMFGSRLYGTATATSDTDIKSIFVPSARDIALQSVTPVVSRSTSDAAIRNTVGDVDEETFALHRYFKLLEKGESFALEMLFAPNTAILTTSDAWGTITANRSRLVTRKSLGFFGYARRQAEIYGAKGLRMRTLRTSVEFFEQLIGRSRSQEKLGTFADEIDTFAKTTPHATIVELPTVSGEPLRHLDICGKKTGFTTALKTARDVYAKALDDYGHRARAAERNDGVDWKALSHAVRIGCQGVELLTTGTMTFPRPEAAELLAIKQGRIPADTVAERLEALLIALERAAETSTLRETADHAWIDDTVFDLYAQQFRA